MTDIQQMVDELRFLLQREVVDQSDELTRLVREYAQACHEVNVRLRGCEECLKKGLRSEALHRAEVSPNLLDLVAVLDFAESDSLREVAAMYFLTSPEPLLQDVASELNEAYALQEPLKQLLDSHRLLALGRCPLPQRLSVLRALAEQDAESPHWGDDVCELERARLSELDTESREAAARGDLAALKAMVGELQADGWRVEVPTGLLRTLKSRANDIARKQSEQRIVELNAGLHAAFSALDVAAARRLRDEWVKRQPVAQLKESDALWEEVAPVLDWLADEDRKLEAERTYTKNVASIERALDREDLTADELKRLGSSFDRHERTLPPVLETRFRNRLATLDLTEGRRRTLLIGAGFAAFAVVIAVAGTAIYASYTAEQTRRLVVAADAFIDEGKLDEARQLIDRQPAGLISESWLAVQKRLADAEQAERDRLSQWQADIDTVEQAAGPATVEPALKRLRETSRTADEKIAVGKLQASWQQQVQTEVSQRERQYREALKLTSDALVVLDGAIAKNDGIDRSELQNLRESAESRFTAIQLVRGAVAPELVSQAKLLETRLRASQKAIVNMERKSVLLAKLTAAAYPMGVKSGVSIGTYESTLREFATTLPDDPVTATFTAAADTSPLPSVRARQLLVDHWKKMLPSEEKDVEVRLREVRTFLNEHAQSADGDAMNRYATWLMSVQRRFADQGDPDEGAKRRLLVLFNSKFIGSGHILRHEDGRTFYLPEEAEFDGSLASFKYYVGFNDETKTPVPPIVPTKLLQRKTVPPPQQEIAKEVRKDLADVGLSNWRDYFLTLSEELLQARQVDPFLRYLLVLKTLEYAGMGDQMLEHELEPVMAKLNDDDLDRSVSWMDPESKSAKKARERAAELLAEVSSLTPYFMRAAQRETQLEREVFARRLQVGWLDRSNRGEWICRTNWAPTSDHVLQIASPPSADGKRQWRELGRVQGTNLSINPTIAEASGIAAVVFALPPASNAETAQSP